MPRGRPRKHPVGTTATERVNMMRERRRAECAGMSRIEIVISTDARAALDAAKFDDESDQAAIERVLVTLPAK